MSCVVTTNERTPAGRESPIPDPGQSPFSSSTLLLLVQESESQTEDCTTVTKHFPRSLDTSMIPSYRALSIALMPLSLSNPIHQRLYPSRDTSSTFALQLTEILAKYISLTCRRIGNKGRQMVQVRMV